MLVLAVHTVATVSASVPFAMIMLRFSRRFVVFSVFANTILQRVPVGTLIVCITCASGRVQRRVPLFAGITCAKTTSPQACTADWFVYNAQSIVSLSILSFQTFRVDRCCLAPGTAQSACGMYQTRKLCRPGLTSFWMWIVRTKSLRWK